MILLYLFKSEAGLTKLFIVVCEVGWGALCKYRKRDENIFVAEGKYCEPSITNLLIGRVELDPGRR